MNPGIATPPKRLSYLSISLMAITLPLAGCLGGGGGSDDERRTGTFVDSHVAGLDYSAGSNTGTTSDTGTFRYRPGETVTFSIGDLVLGAAVGAEVMTPLSIIQGATDASDPRVNNMLILLQTLDADGNLNNGIQITEQIRTEVSLAAADINFDQPVAGWRARGMQAYHAAELAYLFNKLDSVVTHYQLGLVLDPATGSSLVIGDLNGNGVSGSRGDPADIMASAGFDATDEEVVDRMMTIWTNFAKTG
ncbi:MAG: hypothetical protein CMK85_12975, partial [Pseudomonadales bacterium]|nr:hypothetical protein [Pseudomonadales bacterium]